MSDQLDLNTLRAQKARLAHRFGMHTDKAAIYFALILLAAAAALYTIDQDRLAYFAGFVALGLGMIAAWHHFDLAPLVPTGKALDDRLSGDVLARLQPGQPQTPQSVWHDLKGHWQLIFFTNHLLLTPDAIEPLLSKDQADVSAVWQEATRLADTMSSPTIEVGHTAAALLKTAPKVTALLTQRKASSHDIESIAQWLGRGLDTMRAAKPYFGGIGRDWANGFTPHLNQFGHNVSLAIERQGGAHFGWLMSSPGVTAVKRAFSQGAPAVALVGESGVGKTSHVYALAQSLLQEQSDRSLEHRQIISLNPSVIISTAQRPGELEFIMNTLLSETVHAGHIILFLDDAQLFFTSGVGTFDITQILLPVIQSRRVQLVLAMTPHDFQQLQSRNTAFAALLTPVMLQDPDEATVMGVLEDTATGMEGQHHVLIAYEALSEAYRLSGRYDQETAYPGKAIRLLEQALAQADNNVVSAQSVQRAIEQSRGVKVGAAAPAEADQLLHLEDEIHRHMINQKRAVNVVASALRRARAGVANPKRPLGSFLFLGPTGVGKTELAKAIATTYFHAETNMIRLDMSEYQQSDDVSRLLSDGSGESASLIMAVRQQPFSVILLDEIEKAHPNILNLLLQLLDEGQLTDTAGRVASFKDTILIATSNAGADTIRTRIEQGEELESFEKQFVDELISSNQFKPELLNRFDEIVLFRPLNQVELGQVVGLMMHEVNATLATQNISVKLTEAATQKIVETGFDARLGARPMRRALQRAVEDSIAERILSGSVQPGDSITLDVTDLKL